MIKYLIAHHTAGNYKPCDVDIKSYQKLVDDEGNIIIGSPQGKTSSTAGMNSITYNIACCGGLDRTPIKRQQAENFYKECAKEIKRLNLTPSAFYTHAMIGELCREYINGTGKGIVALLPFNKYLADNIGKIDLRKLPDCSGTAKKTNDFARNKVQWYFERL